MDGLGGHHWHLHVYRYECVLLTCCLHVPAAEKLTTECSNS